jgi:hypothetical protein
MSQQRVQRFLTHFTRAMRSDQAGSAQSVGRAAALQPPVASLSRSWCGGLKTRHTNFFCAERDAPLRVSKPPCRYLTRSFTGEPSVLHNPSLKRRDTGVPPGPRGRAVYHRPRGPAVTPPSPD